MIFSGADLLVGEVRGRVCRLLHHDWRMPFGGGVVAKLAIFVVPPCPGVAVAAQGQRIRASGADLHVGEIRGRACRLLHHDWRSPVVGVRPVAKGAIAVVSPGVGFPVAAQGQ